MSTFPQAALGQTLELLLSGTWTDVTSYLDNGTIVITRGHQDESTQVSASELDVTLQNSSGAFSAKNPSGPYYGSLGRNVQARASIPAQLAYLRLEDGASAAICPDSASLEVTGDLDVRLDFRPSGYNPGLGSPTLLAAKAYNALYGGTQGTGLSWLLELGAAGTLTFTWTPDGSTLKTVTSTLAIPFDCRRLAVRATLAHATGTVTFYTAATMGGSWTQLGTAASGTGGASTSVYGSNVPLAVGWLEDGSGLVTVGATGLCGRVYELQLLNGIGGTVVADPVFSSQTAGASSFADGESNTWTMYGTAALTGRDYRCHAEVPEWPQQQSPTGSTVTVAAKGGGLLRRKGQLNNPLSSVMTRYWQKAAAPAAYWPMEDGSGSASLASGIGGAAMTYTGSPQLASSSVFACSGSLPVLNGAVLTGSVPNGATAWLGGAVLFLLAIPSGGDTAGTVCTVATGGTIDTFTLTYSTGSGGTLTATAYQAGTNVGSGTVATGVNGQLLAVQLEVYTISVVGATIGWYAAVLQPGSDSPSSAFGSYTGGAAGVTAVRFNDGGSLTQTAAGQCAALLSASAGAPAYPFAPLNSYQLPDGTFTGPLDAWAGEPAGVRFARLCSEEGVPFRGRGNMLATMGLGAQSAQTLTQLLQECADADQGVWSEPRQVLGWAYTARAALYNQSAMVALDYDQDHMSEWASNPTEDDQVIHNDVTLTQTTGGGMARQYAAPGQPVTGGALSTLAPPDGVGTYDSAPVSQVNVQALADLADLAGWMVHLGTADEPRYPGLLLDLDNADLAALFWDILDLDLGMRLTVADPPVWLPPDEVSQLAQALTETLGNHELTLVITGVPERPYEVAQDGGTYHVDTDGTTLNAGVSSTATSMSFATASGYPLWSVNAGDYPCDVMIAGEEVAVTAMSGSSSPQTATVTRSVNGVVKAQLAAAAVNVYPSPVAAL